MVEPHRTEETVTLAERLGPAARTITESDVAKRMRRDVSAAGKDAAENAESILDVVSKAAEDLVKSFERAGDDVTDGARSVGRELSAAAGEAVDGASDAAGRAGRELKLDKRVDDVVKRIRKELPTERIQGLVASLERELPGTDKDRYDRAYSRGWTRARTSFVGVGLAAGVAAGIAGAFLLDPQRGAQRRATIASKAREIGTTVTREARSKATWTADRARGIAVERGLLKPDEESTTPPVDDPSIGALASETPPLVPVMDPVVGGDPAAMDVDGSPAMEDHEATIRSS
jgi:hypothetical protein